MKVVFFLLILFLTFKGYNQSIPAGNRLLEDYFRREQLVEGFNLHNNSFALRPLINKLNNLPDSLNFKIRFTPIYSTSEFNLNRPYGWGNGIMLPNSGLQEYFSVGVFMTSKFFEIQIQPEITIAQNNNYFGFPDTFSKAITQARFRFWNFSDVPERFGIGVLTRYGFGQSKAVLKYKKVEIGISSQNIWWGPGQSNALTFSKNAQGFPYLTFNTREPLNTFIGNFEGQIIVGRLENSGLDPTQIDALNQAFFRRFNGDWRYLNAMMISYNPKWVPGLFLGLNRTYQQYNERRGNSFRELFPIFDPFQKTEFGFDRDSEGRDQQATVFARFVAPKARAEIYFEYGRRDHAFSWREAIINPEHARAYLFGFMKLFALENQKRSLQVRGEVTQQQESINRIIRYPGLVGRYSWHMHQLARGFVENGEQFGVGIGPGSNVQNLEVSLVEKFSKVGILLERVANHQDFYYRAFGQQREHQPWVDLSIGLLFDKKWDNLLLSSKFQLINGFNYQWQLASDSNPEFPTGQHLFSVHSQVSLIYLFQQRTSLD